MTTIHTLLFADPDASVWGVYWLPAEAGSAPLACQAEEATALVTARLAATEQAEPWQLQGDEVSLVFRPSGPGGGDGSPGSSIASRDQLCAVSGSLALHGVERGIDCLGWRARLEGDFDLAGIETLRQTYGWFDPADGLGLVALRPRKARGHDDDLIAATVLDPEPSPAVADPRLSSTYDSVGLPVRVGLELWFTSENEAEESDGDGDRQFPRHAAGEATGAPIRWEVGEFRMRAVPLRWHSRGNDGAGAYLLGQRG